MFIATHLTGFGARAESAALVETLVDRTLGTNIGDMTSNGGLAASFDGNTSQAGTVASVKGSTTSAYIGKTHAAAKICSRVVVHGTNNVGFSTQSAASITLTLYGKNGSAPASATDGTVLGTLSFTETDAGEAAGREIASTDTATAYDHWWVRIVPGSSASLACAELVMYEMA